MILVSVLSYVLSAYLSLHTLASPTPAQTSTSSTNATATPPQLRTPPNPYIYRYDPSHEVVFERRSTHHTKLNPSTNIYNFRAAIQDAGRRIIALQEQTHDQGSARFPSNKFVYEETLARPAHTPRGQAERTIKIEVHGVNYVLYLSYDAVKIVMLGLIQYAALWDNGYGTHNRVGMCNFTLYWLQYGGQRIAEGGVSLDVPDAPTEVVATS
ncbi:hypothetical protein G7Y79_00032g067580 [Physcia stellaris]|nr:hypothetical protein G7Y79_00032g067580 [Physcia stellaris]